MRFKEVKKLINEQAEAEQLFEVNMSPSNLAKLANQIDARAGMEFEMIVPDTEGSDDGEQEPDYEMDESVGDIEDACNFFYDGDFNGRREIDRLRDSMLEDYSTWVYEKTDEDWHSGNGYEFFLEYMDRNNEYDRDSGLDDARDYVRENNPDLEPSSDEFSEAVSERLNELEAAFYQEEWERQGRNYDYAREEFDDEKQNDYDQSDWLDSAGLSSMTDVAREYDVTWPHYTNVSNGGRSVEDIADNFSRAIGRPVNSSTSYHGARREEGTYVVEPDGSLEGDNPGDTGLEFVSPPLPLSELLSDLRKVQKWAKSEGCYTGADYNTGLHINVSVPGLGEGQENLDYVKLALLLGDEHVLKEFERTGNTYCKSGLEIVKKNIKDKPENAKALLDQMKSGLEQMASRAIHGAITNKFTSINTKDGYVEFRSPGGDWLNEKFDKIEPTLLRFVVALDAAVKPDLYRQEYLKKLYKALEPAGNKSTIEYFAKYVAGEIPKAALRSFIKQAQLERKLKAGKAEEGITVAGRPNNPEGNWYLKNEDTNEIFYRFNAANYQDAYGVLQQWKQENPDSTINAVYGFGRDEPAQAEDRTYRITSTGGSLIAGDEYGDDQTALQRAQYWAQRRGVNVVVRNPQGQEVGRVSAFGEITPTAQPAASTDQGNWGIWMTNADRFANRAGSYARGETPPLYRFPSREAAESWLEQQRAERPNMRNDIEVREIESNAQGASEQAPNWEIERAGTVVYRFHANNQDDAIAKANDYIRAIGGDMNSYTVQAIEQPAQQQSSVNNLTPHGPGPWELYNTSTGSVFRHLEHTNRAAAETEAETYYNLYSSTLGDISNYAVRTRQGSAPAQSGAFTGEWKVVDPQGTEIYRFSGVGNSQSDANRVAMDWLRRNPQQLQGGVEVLPVMGEA